MKRCTAALVILACLIVCGCKDKSTSSSKGSPATEPAGLAWPLPAHVVAAWKKAGAEAGWMKDREFRAGNNGQAGEVPAFVFVIRRWEPGVLTRLPAPSEPFRLVLVGDRVTDAALKELVEMKQLQALILAYTKVTDTGVQELQRELPACKIIR